MLASTSGHTRFAGLVSGSLNDDQIIALHLGGLACAKRRRETSEVDVSFDLISKVRTPSWLKSRLGD